MLFNSLSFLVFFPVVTGLYFLLPQRYRWLLLLLASCYFYMAFVPVYILILGFTIVIDYFAGISIEKAQGATRKLFLVASIIANVGVLAVFKYYNFIDENLALLLHGTKAHPPVPYLDILLPIGLSFHTFQAMSYTIEVYRGHQKAERHFGIYALYVMFFPQLVAGPIERPQHMLPQFREKHAFDYARVVEGLRLMLWGFFKKIVIADRLAVYVGEVYDHPGQYHGFTVLLATYFFAFQVFCDFSAYSDIAVGSARVLGFDLTQNFNLPYFSRSFREFWSRWHISLSSWVRDYLYIPLGGNRVPQWRRLLNVLIVFSICGLWHGAKWTMVVWGTLHGFYIVCEMIAEKAGWLSKLPKTKFFRFLQWGIWFHFYILSLVIFRSANMHDVGVMLKSLFHFVRGKSFFGLPLGYGMPLYDKLEILLSFALIGLLFWINWQERKKKIELLLQPMRPVSRWLVYYAVVMLIVLLGNYSNRMDFIYFQF